MDRQVIEAIKQRINIVDVVRRYVNLRPASGRHMGLCPFHQEKTASFSVNEAEGFYYCFGCQAGGDVIDFYRRVNGLEFKDALEQLAEEAGVELERYTPDPEYDERQKLKRLCLDMHTAAQDYFRRNLELAAGDASRAYLRRRGMSEDTIAAFGLGASPEDWHGLHNHLRGKGFTPEQGVQAGLLSKNDKADIYDRFRGRLIFPIQNLSGQVIAFGGRVLTDGEPKYLNSSDTPIYKKGEHLYGLYQARQPMTRSKRAILTEGYMDVLSLHQFGYADSCGVLGTALTQDQVKRLAGFVSRMDLIFDGDTAGRKAALRSSEMILQYGVACRVVLMPDGEDVDSLLQQGGRDRLDACFGLAEDGLDFCLRTVRQSYAPREIVGWANGFLNACADNGLRAFYLPRLAKGLEIAEADLRRFRAAQQGDLRQRSRAAAQTVTQPAQQGTARPAPLGRDNRDDRYYLRFPVQYPEYVPELLKRGFDGLLVTDWARGFWEKLAARQEEGMPSGLQDDEKAFWAKCRSEDRPEGDALAQEWEHICSRILEAENRRKRDELTERIRAASERGDTEELKRLMTEFSHLTAPSTEEE
jgi:DNA primase